MQSQISVDGRGKTTLRSSQQAIQSQLCRPKAGSRRVALPSVVLVRALSGGKRAVAARYPLGRTRPGLDA